MGITRIDAVVSDFIATNKKMCQLGLDSGVKQKLTQLVEKSQELVTKDNLTKYYRGQIEVQFIIYGHVGLE